MPDPWPALERAHVASQPSAWPHTRVDAAMLGVAWRQRDRCEMVGQVVRLLVAGPGSLAGRYPPGNTGRTTAGLTEHGPHRTRSCSLRPCRNLVVVSALGSRSVQRWQLPAEGLRRSRRRSGCRRRRRAGRRSRARAGGSCSRARRRTRMPGRGFRWVRVFAGWSGRR
ncbi:MAG: hypothetical protein C4344_02730, partial [Acidimicrobiia bacterium]